MSVTDNQTNTVFTNAENLRVAHLGISDKIRYDNDQSREYSYVRFFNIVEVDGKLATAVVLSNVNTVINASNVTAKNTDFYRSYVNAENYEGIYQSDFYDYVKVFEYTDSNGNRVKLEVSVSLPSYVFYEQKDANGNLTGNLTLFAVSPDTEMASEYTTPEYLYIDTGDQTKNTVDDGKGITNKKPVKTIGKYAYGLVTMYGTVSSLKIGAQTIVIEDCAFRGSSNIAGSTNTVLGNTVETVDLSNVTTIGSNAFYESKFKTVKADSVQYLASSAFLNCTNFTYIHLPMFKAATGEKVFSGCTALKEITLGKFTESFSHNMFNDAKSLTRINILSEAPVSLGANPDSIVLVPIYAKNVSVYVHGGAYQEYLDTYYDGVGKTFGGISKNNLKKYGETVEVGNIRYYLNKIDSTTAYVDYVESITNTAFPTDFSIDAKLGAYDILGVSSSAIQSLTNVTTIILPSSMKYMMFTAADLPSTVSAFEISSENGFFMTSGGVLYSKDEKILYAYPKAKAVTDDVFVIGDAVEQIFDEAFYGASTLKEINIEDTVVINDRVFVGASSLEKITFNASAAASTFAGWDILSGANGELKIYVPSAKLNKYKENVLIDYSILDKFVGQ